MARPEKIRIGDLLIQEKLISQEQLRFALEQQKRSGRKLGRVLIENGFATEDSISHALAKQLKIPYVDLKYFNINPNRLKSELTRALDTNRRGNASTPAFGLWPEKMFIEAWTLASLEFAAGQIGFAASQRSREVGATALLPAKAVAAGDWSPPPALPR